ncbi:hypothetical protein ACH4TX_04310 [Streptomyces sp. NPDC021098]|uniref:hypothetical protein n=1 Tax=Streptomyces sp. NPDC021098 TaxID=3365113 RepID=UPI0037AEA83D
MTAALACLALGAALAGCTHGASAEAPSPSKEPTARQLIDTANDTMKALTSVTIDANSFDASGEDRSTRLRTDLKGRCAYKTTWPAGPRIEQIRIGETDYVRTNRAYDKRWPGKGGPDTHDSNRWITSPSSEAPDNGLADCTWDFTTFGVAKKRGPSEVDGRPAIRLIVTDKEDEGGAYNFHIATEGKPYILKVVYEGAEYHSVTTFSAFDEPLDVRPPAKAVGG